MGLYGDLDTRDVAADFMAAVNRESTGNWADRLAVRLQSDSEVEEHHWLGSLPQMRRWLGGRQEQNLALYRLAIRNEPFEGTIAVFEEDLRRAKSSQLQARIGQLGDRFRSFPNTHLSTLITNAEAGTSGLAYDGQYFFDTDHAESGTSQTNDLTATEIPAANVADPDAPTALEAQAIVNQVTGHLMSFTDDKGEPINGDLGTVVIMVGNTMYRSALITGLGAQFFAGGVTNPLPLNAQATGTRYEVVLNPRLSATADKMYFFAADASFRPFIIQEERGLVFESHAAGSYEAFKNRRYLYGVSWWGGFGYGNWQASALVTLS